MGSSPSHENQYKQIEADISKVRTTVQSTVEGIQEAMKAMSEEQVDEELDDMHQLPGSIEEDAEIEKEEQNSILQLPNEKSRFYDIGLEIRNIC